MVSIPCVSRHRHSASSSESKASWSRLRTFDGVAIAARQTDSAEEAH